jgi:hypothetical protein
MPPRRMWGREAFPIPNEPYLHAEPPPGRRQPVKAASRAAGARHAPALTGWRWSGPLAGKQIRLSCHSEAQPPRPAERPIDPAAGHGDTGDMPADMVFEHGPPRHEAEAEPVIDHGELAAR